MNKKIFDEKIKLLEEMDKKIESMENDFEKFKKNIKERDYLVRTKFLGKLKDKNVIKDFKSHEFILNRSLCTLFSDTLPQKNIWGTGAISYPFEQPTKSFQTCVSEILEFKFEALNLFCTTLQEFEKEQEVLEKYKENDDKKKNKQYE